MPIIDPLAYFKTINRFLNNGMIIEPIAYKEVFELYYDDNDELIGWNTKYFDTLFTCKDSLRSHEQVNYEKNMYCVKEYSYHFEPINESNKKIFRVDNCHKKKIHFHHYQNVGEHQPPDKVGYALEDFNFLYALKFCLLYLKSEKYPFDKENVKPYCRLLCKGGNEYAE